MVGGGNRRDESSFTVSNTNVFAALESLRKKKKSEKEKGSSKGGKGSSKTGGDAEAGKQVFWAPAPLTATSWADVDDEDDDDYYATTAPPQAIWGDSSLSAPEETDKPEIVEETESEDELLDEGDDDDVEEGHEQESEVHEEPEPLVQKAAHASEAPKETERQLSKKERKKKELEELEAILADFGVNPQEKAEDVSSEAAKEQKDGLLNGNPDKDNPPAESKSAKKKKKKEKASKDAKEPQDQTNSTDVGNPNGQEEAAGVEVVEEDASTVDVKERLKRVASSKKKKSNKEMDGAARAAAAEAAARSKKLAAAKKKEKNHYNQQPVR